MKNSIITSIKGLVVGSSMLLPGVSGGTMAIILGIYDKLIHCISSFKKDIKKNILFLLQFGIGAVLGIILFSNIVLKAVESFKFPMHFLFMGAVLGSIPALLKKTKKEFFNIKDIFIILAGFLVVFGLSKIPSGFFVFEKLDFISFFVLLLAGFIVAVALILPGISASQMLLLLGIYEMVLNSLSEFNILILVPIAAGGIMGIILTTGILEKAMTKFPKVTYLFIIGFVLGSILDIFPGIPMFSQIPICLITFLVGFSAIYFLSKFSKE